MHYAKPTISPLSADIEHAVCCWGNGYFISDTMRRSGAGSCNLNTVTQTVNQIINELP